MESNQSGCNSGVKQEDDSITTAYGLSLEGEGDSRCISLLNTAEEAVARQLRGSKGSFAGRRNVFEGMILKQTTQILFSDFSRGRLHTES